MNFYIKRLRIANFLSFFGEYEVNLKPFSAILCNYHQGKDDLLRAFEFAFGGKVLDLRVETPLELVYAALRQEMVVNNDILSYVEITLDLFQEKKELKFYRGVKNGAYSTRIEHKIGDVVTSGSHYEEKLHSLGIHIKKKNLIFYKSYLNNIIWGSSEDLEMTLTTCLRENYLLEDWEKAKKEVDHLMQIKRRTDEKNVNSLKKSHQVVAKFARKFESASYNLEAIKEEILRELPSPDESSLIQTSTTEKEESFAEAEERKENAFRMETQIDFLMKNLDELRLKEAFFTSRLYHEEIKLSAKPVNASILKNRITQVKARIGEKEKETSKIWTEIHAIKSEINCLSQRISVALISLREIQTTDHLQNRFTSYGRFYDYLEPSRYVQLLKQVIGDDIFYANLCDTMENAFSAIDFIKSLKYEQREVFISFDNYSHKLKDILTASGEHGVQIRTLEQLLIFLCKLKHYGLIDEVPVLAQGNFNYDDNFPEDYIIYLQNGLHCTKEGLVMRKWDESGFCMKTEEELQKSLLQLQTEEEIKYHEWNDLLFEKWRTLVDMNSLENDLFYLKQKWKKTAQKPRARSKPTPLPEIYAEYSKTFEKWTEEWEKCERESQAEEDLFPSGSSESVDLSTSSSEECANLGKDLEEINLDKDKLQNQIQALTRELRFICIFPTYSFRSQKHLIKLNNLNKTRLFFEKEFKKLKKLMAEDDLEDFLGSQEWRKTFIDLLTKDFNEIRKKLKISTETLQNLATTRKEKLYPFLEHCSQHLPHTFRNLLSDALPFVEISFNSGEEKLRVTSSLGEERVNLIEMSHFNTFLKFVATLSIFLEIAVFDKIPLMIFEDIEEYFPPPVDNLEAVLQAKTLEKIIPHTENPRFQLLLRVGEYLQHYIKRHTPGNSIRKNGTNKDNSSGPIQIIYFVKEDLIHSADHYIWIHNQVLPDEYITEHCSSYSEIHEIICDN